MVTVGFLITSNEVARCTVSLLHRQQHGLTRPVVADLVWFPALLLPLLVTSGRSCLLQLAFVAHDEHRRRNRLLLPVLLLLLPVLRWLRDALSRCWTALHLLTRTNT